MTQFAIYANGVQIGVMPANSFVQQQLTDDEDQHILCNIFNAWAIFTKNNISSNLKGMFEIFPQFEQMVFGAADSFSSTDSQPEVPVFVHPVTNQRYNVIGITEVSGGLQLFAIPSVEITEEVIAERNERFIIDFINSYIGKIGAVKTVAADARTIPTPLQSTTPVEPVHVDSFVEAKNKLGDFLRNQ